MAIVVLSPRQDVNEYIGFPADMSRAQLVMDRVAAAMRENNMVLGPSGVFISPEGISVDTQLDQSTVNAAWMAFDIANYRTPTERKKKEAEAAALAAIASLRSDASNLNNLALTLSTNQIRQGIARIDNTLALLIEYLIDNGVIPRS